MPITLDASTITVAYQAGDTKGNSWANPYTMADIYNAAVANGWSGVSRIGNMYTIEYTIWISGSSTYFWAYEKNGLMIFFDFPEPRQALRTAGSCYFRSGFNREGMGSTGSLYYIPTIWCTAESNKASTGMGLVQAKIEIWNTVFNYIRPQINGLAETPVIIDNVTVYNAVTFELDLTDGYVQATNIYAYNSTVSLGTSLVELSNVHLFKNSKFYSIWLYTLEGKNINFYDNSSLYFQVANGMDREVTLIDSNVTKYGTYYANWSTSAIRETSEYTLYLKSTFNFIISNSEDATLTLYDKDDSVVIDMVLDGSVYSSEVTYVKEIAYHEYDGVTANVAVTAEEYEPFNLKISKTGYRDITISDISIIPGEPTFIRAEFQPLVVFISSVTETHCTNELINDGSLTVEVTGGHAPYEYSINDGETWQESNIFENLAPGDYEVKVKDSKDEESEIFITNISKPKTKFFMPTLSI